MKLEATTIPEMAKATGIVFDRVRKTKTGYSFIKEYTGSFFSHMGEIASMAHINSRFENAQYSALTLAKHSVRVKL